MKGWIVAVFAGAVVAVVGTLVGAIVVVSWLENVVSEHEPTDPT